MTITNLTTNTTTKNNVKFMPATIESQMFSPEDQKNKKRVAAYARVSTEQDEQQNSYEAQKTYYTSYILSNPDWELAGIYADEGISGTSMRKRDGLNRMIADAKAGKIDLVLVKSISRLARNTVDSLNIARELKRYGTEIKFEKEGINTFDSSCEIVFTIFSSTAQEESRSISENVTWGHKRNMEKGKTQIAFSNFLGYDKGSDGNWAINEEEAKIVRQIYDWFLDYGRTINWIADKLTEREIPTPMGKKKWRVSTVESILTNEKYKGDALMQKTFTPNFLDHKPVKNNGEKPQYYATDHHPAIIEPERFDLAQQEMKRRCKHRRQISNNSPFTARLICADCGTFYGHKIQRKKQVWYCNHRYEGGKTCETPIIPEEELELYFQTALERELARIAAGNGPQALSEAEEAKLAEELVKARDRAEIALQEGLAKFRSEFYGPHNCDHDEFDAKLDAATAQITALKTEVRLAEEAITDNTAKKENLRRFANATKDLDPQMAEYTDDLFIATIKEARVSKVKNGKYSITYTFTNGDKISVENLE